MAGKKGEKTISLAAVLDLNEAAALRGKLMGLRGGNQVIMAAAKTWDEDKLSFTFSKVSDAFQKTMQLIGVNVDHLLAREIRQ